MSFEIKRASKKDRHLRLSLDGISGSGKTFTALALACYLSKKIDPEGIPVVIDSEGNSSEDYADLFEFDVVPLGPPYSPEQYMAAMDFAAEQDHRPVVVADSFSHLWAGEGGELEMVDKLAARDGKRDDKFGRGWREVSPKHNKVINHVLHYPKSLIGTLRQKSDYVIKDGKPQKIGMKPIMREAWEYEFTIAGSMDDKHNLTITKSRMHGLYDAGDVIQKPGEEFFEKLWRWMHPSGGGYAPTTEQPPAPVERDASLKDILGIENGRELLHAAGVKTQAEFNHRFKGKTVAEVMADIGGE